MRGPQGVGQGPKAVALGGGHGLAASLSALRLAAGQVTAVVTVADDGGSSGRLREELGVLPPGDLRMALAALCEDSEWGRTWRDLLQYRFSSPGSLDSHAVGNLLIAALWEQLGDTVTGLDWVGRLLNARGRVLPMASVPLAIEAVVVLDGVEQVVHGQSAVATTSGHIQHIALVPAAPPACDEAVAAVDDADWVILGPGSWFTSVIPHLLVPDLAAALHRTEARRCVTLNLSPETGETRGMSATEHLARLHAHAPQLRVDAVIADPRAVEDVEPLFDQAALMGARVVLRQVGVSDGSPLHDPLRLAAAYRDVFDGQVGDVGAGRSA